MLAIDDLVHLNAVLNGTALLLVLSGLRAIKQKKETRHKCLMLTAGLVSAFFLISYLIYHFNCDPVKFSGSGGWKVLYLSILVPHIVLAAVSVPLILLTIFRGLTGQIAKHKKIARWTAAIWIYVSISGVAVYLILYS